jgi:flagellar biosynthetic protein FliQ
MNEAYFLLVAREGLYLALLLSAPPLLAVLLVGVLSSAFQTVTQLHEPTLAFVPKLIAVALALMAAGPFIGEQLVRFTRILFGGVADIGP